MILAIFGRKSGESFNSLGPGGWYWRTSPAISAKDSTKSSGRWPKAGICLHGTCSPLHSLGRRTFGDGSSSSPSLPTPVVTDQRTARNATRGGDRSNSNDGWTLGDVVWMLPTPMALDYRSGRTKVDYGNSRPLNEAVLAMDAHLARLGGVLPTPTAQSYGSSVNGILRHGSEKEKPRKSAGRPSLDTLARSTAPTDGAGVERAGSGLRLNPLFSLWLMGFPDNWLDPEGPSLAPSATQ